MKITNRTGNPFQLKDQPDFMPGETREIDDKLAKTLVNNYPLGMIPEQSFLGKAVDAVKEAVLPQHGIQQKAVVPGPAPQTVTPQAPLEKGEHRDDELPNGVKIADESKDHKKKSSK